MSESETEGTENKAKDARIQSGIPRLDFILKGGLKLGGIYALMGPPGSGKTILANQLCCNHIQKQEGRCVYMTLLVESHAKMLSHLSTLSFFKPEFIPERLYYISGYQQVREAGFAGLMELHPPHAARAPGDLVRHRRHGERRAVRHLVPGLPGVRARPAGLHQPAGLHHAAGLQRARAHARGERRGGRGHRAVRQARRARGRCAS